MSRMENALTHVTLTTPAMMDLNLSAAFLTTALHCVAAFQDCKETTKRIGASFFIGIRNSTGLPVSYQIVNDNGINALDSKRREQKVEETRDAPCFAGLADVGFAEGLRTCWVSLHYTRPMLRVYDSIPSLYTTDPLVWSDGVEVGDKDAECIFSPICVVRGESSRGEEARSEGESNPNEDTHNTLTIYCENDDEAQLWKNAIQEAMKKETAIDAKKEQVKTNYLQTTSVSSLSSRSSDVLVTSLPAHPSLTLKYFHQPYRKSPPRLLSLAVADYPSFDLFVDRTESRFVKLSENTQNNNTQNNNTQNNNTQTCEIFIESTIEQGRKIINIGSNVSVRNNTAIDVLFAFGNWVNEADIAYGDVTASTLRKSERQWMSVCGEENQALFLGKEELVRCLALADLQRSDKAYMVNLGTVNDPYYVYLSCEVSQVVNKEDARDQRSAFCIVVSDVAQFENLLPVSIDYRVVNKYENTAMEGTIAEGGVVSLSKCKFSKDESYRVLVRLTEGPYPFCSYAAAVNLQMASGTVHLEKRTEFKNLNLSFITARNAFHSMTVQLFCDYWVVNKTGEAVVVRDAKSPDFEYTLPSPPLELKNRSDVVCAKEALALPALISVKKKDKNDAIRLSLPGYEDFSESFSVNTLGVTGVVTLAAKGRHKPEKAFGVAITRAPGLFARSFVVTLSPLYIVMNRIDKPVRLRQVDCDSEVALDSEGYCAFHWSSKTGKHAVQVKIEGEEYKWSQGFELVPGHLSIQMTKKRDKVSRYDVWSREEVENPVDHPYSVIQVDITMIDSQCYVFLKKMVVYARTPHP